MSTASAIHPLTPKMTAALANVPMDRARKSATRSQVVLLASTALQLLMSLAVTVLVGRAFEPADHGFFALIAVIFVAARELIDLGTGNMAAREIVRDPQRERNVLEGLMAWRRAFGILLALTVAAFALRTQNPHHRYVMLAAAVVLAAMAPTAVYAAFQVRQAQEAPAILGVGAQLLVVIGAIVAYCVGASGPVFALLLVAREAINIIGLRLLGWHVLGYWPRAGFRGRGLGTFLKSAAIYGLAALVHNIYFHGDFFLVSAYLGQSAAGAYAAALRPINPLLSLPWIVMVPLVPVLAQVAIRDRPAFARQVRSYAALAIGIGATGAVAAVLLAPDLLRLLYGGRYLDGDLSAVSSFRWLSLAFGSLCVTPVFATAMLADGRERQLLGYGIVALMLNVALNLWGLPRLGFVAAAMATALTQLAVCATLMILTLAADRDRIDALRWILYLIPAAVIAAALTLLPGTPVFRVACGVVLGMLAIALLLRARARRSGTPGQDQRVARSAAAEPLVDT